VTQEDALKFKHYMNTDKVDFNMTRPSYPTYYDRNMDFARERKFWGVSSHTLNYINTTTIPSP